MHIHIRSLSFITLIIISNNYFLLAQEFNDFGIWTQASIDKKIAKKTILNGQIQGRLSENSTAFTRLSFGLGLTYKINKSFRLSVGSVFIRRSENPGELLSNRHRLYADLTYRKNFNRLVLNYRVRFQSQQTDIYSSEMGMYPDYFLRNKVSLKYDWNLFLSPFISEELFIPTNNLTEVNLSRSRSIAGMEYHLNKRNDLQIYFLYQRDLYNKPVSNLYTLGLGYSLKL